MSINAVSENIRKKSKKINHPRLSACTDDAWKDILHCFFKEFIEFFCPDLYSFIDWSKGFEFLDKEFQTLIKHQKKGKRLTDKLVKVWHKELGEAFLLIHIEVQDGKEIGFSFRMFNYYYRILDRYHVPVLCIAVLVDNDSTWRPNVYETGIKTNIGNCQVKFTYPVIKLIDYESQVDMLETNENPFALVVLCQLAALKSRNNADLRKISKFHLAKKLFKRQWHRDKIIDLLKFIDGILRLPEEIEKELVRELKQEMEGEPSMSYVTSFEYFAELRGIEKGKQEGVQQGIQQGVQQGIQQGVQQGIQQGVQQGIQQGVQQGIQKGEARILMSQLEAKFKTIPERYKQQIANANPDIILTWANRLLTADTLEEIFN